MKYIFSILFLVATVAFAQTYSPGLPMPGLPKSLGQKPMASSTSVTIANDQNPITVTGSLIVSNPSIGTPGLPMPISATAIGIKDQSGNLQFLPIGPSGITVSASQGTTPWVTFIPSGVGVTNTVTAVIPSGVGVTNTVTAFIPSGVGITNTVTAFIPSGVGITNTPSVFIPGGVGITNTVTAFIPAGIGITTTVVSSAATITRIANSASSQTLLSSNPIRKTMFLFNDGSSANCYVKFGTTASLTDFSLKLFYTDTYTMDSPIYTGRVDYICDAASGSMEVTEQ